MPDISLKHTHIGVDLCLHYAPFCYHILLINDTGGWNKLELRDILRREAEIQAIEPKDLQPMAEVSAAMINHIFTGRREGTLETLLKIVDALHLKLVVVHRSPKANRRYEVSPPGRRRRAVSG